MEDFEQDGADGLTALYLAKADMAGTDQNDDEEIEQERQRLGMEYGPVVNGFFRSKDRSNIEPPTHQFQNNTRNKHGRKRERNKQEEKKSLERNWVGAQIPVSERIIPKYDAVKDPHCAYTKFSKSFNASPFSSMQRESRKTANRILAGPDTSNDVFSHSLPRVLHTNISMNKDKEEEFVIDDDFDLNEIRQEALESIEARELLLRRLMSADRHQSDSGQQGSMVRLLRAAALRCCETIATWHRAVRRAMIQSNNPMIAHPPYQDYSNDTLEMAAMEASNSGGQLEQEGEFPILGPMPFEWRGMNYLAKMADDSKVPIGRIQALVDALPPNCSLDRNPFLLEHNLDDTAVLVVPPIVSDSVKTGMSHGIELLRLRRAARLILAEESLRGKYQDEDEQEPNEGVVARTPISSSRLKSAPRRTPSSKGRSREKKNAATATVSGPTAPPGRNPPRSGQSVKKLTPPLTSTRPKTPNKQTLNVSNDMKKSNHQTRSNKKDKNEEMLSSQQLTKSTIPLKHQSEMHARLASGLPALHPAPPVIPLAELEALAKLTNPPIPVVVAFAAARVLLSQNVHVLPNLAGTGPTALRAILRRPKILARQLQSFDLACPVRPIVVKVLRPIVMNPKLSVMEIQRDSPCAGALFAWVKKVVLQHLQRVGAKMPDPNKLLIDRLHRSGGGRLENSNQQLGGSNGSFKAYLSLKQSSNKDNVQGTFMNDPYFQDSFADVEMEDEFFRNEQGGGMVDSSQINAPPRKNHGLSLRSEGDIYNLDDEGIGGENGYYSGDGEDEDGHGGELIHEKKKLTAKERRLYNERLDRRTTGFNNNNNDAKHNDKRMITPSLNLPNGNDTSKAQAEFDLEMVDGAAAQILRSLQNQIIGLRSELARRGMLEKEAKFGMPIMHEAWGVPIENPTSTTRPLNDTLISSSSPHQPPPKVFFRPGRVLLWSGKISAPVGGKEDLIKLKKQYCPSTDTPTEIEMKTKDTEKDEEEDAKVKASSAYAEEAARLQAARDAAAQRAATKVKRKNAGELRKFETHIYAVATKGGVSNVLIEAIDAKSSSFLPFSTLSVNAVVVDKLCSCSPNELIEMTSSDREFKLGPLIAALTIDILQKKARISSATLRARRFNPKKNNNVIYHDEDFPDLIALPEDASKMNQAKLDLIQTEKINKIEKRLKRKQLRIKDREIEIEERKARGESYSDLENEAENDIIAENDDDDTDSDDNWNDDNNLKEKKSKSSNENELDFDNQAEGNFKLCLLVDKLCHRDNIVISQRAYEVRATRREAEEGGTGKGGGISFILWPCAGGRGVMDRLKLFVSDEEIELLLLGQPALFFRMTRKWSALQAVTSWLVKRLRMQRKDTKMGIDHDSLWLLRSIKLPNRLEKGWCLNGALTISGKETSVVVPPSPSSSLNKYDVLGGGITEEEAENVPQQFVMRLKQNKTSLILSAVAVPPPGTKEALKFEQTSAEDEEEMEMKVANSHHAPPLQQTSPCILKLSIEEVRSFVGLPQINKLNDLPSHDDEAYASLLDHIKEEKGKSSSSSGGGGDVGIGGSNFDKLMARVSLVPAIEQEKTIQETFTTPSEQTSNKKKTRSKSPISSNSSPKLIGVSSLTANSGVGISIDRTLSVDMREISGIPCSVMTSAHGNDILFTAVRVGQLDIPQVISNKTMATNDDDDDVKVEKVLPIPPAQLSKPLRKLITMEEAAQILKERVRVPDTQAEALLHASHRKELALIIVPQLKIVVKQRRVGEGTNSDKYATPVKGNEQKQEETVESISVAELETSLFQSLYMLTVCVDGENRRNRIGCIEVDDQATLAAVRIQIAAELDPEDIPKSFRFRFNEAPCARKQESMRLACSCVPNLVLYSRDPRRDAKYFRMEGLHPHGDPNDLFGDEDFKPIEYTSAPPMTGKPYDMFDDDEDEEEGRITTNETSMTRKKKKKKKSKVEKKESDSDDDPPPGPAPPRKPPKETGMERRARLRREKRRSRRDAKALRLKRPPDAASGLLHDGPEPIAPEAVLFVPFPLPAVVTVVQGSTEVWANSIIKLNDILTGDDILRIGTVDSADYPVKARSDDVVRKLKPKPPTTLRPTTAIHNEEHENEEHGTTTAGVEPMTAGTEGGDFDRSGLQSASTEWVPGQAESSNKGLTNRQLQRRKALERARELASAAAELEVQSLDEYESKMQTSIALLVSSGGGGDTSLNKELEWADTRIQRHHDSVDTLKVLDSVLSLLAKKEEKKERKKLRQERRKSMQNCDNYDDNDEDDDDDDEDEEEGQNSNNFIVEEVDKPGMISATKEEMDLEERKRLEKRQADIEFFEDCVKASKAEEEEEEIWKKSEIWCDLLKELTPRFGPRTSGISWYPKKEALDEILDITELNSQNNANPAESDEGNSSDDGNSNNSKQLTAAQQFKQKRQSQILAAQQAAQKEKVGVGPHPPAKFIAKGRIGQLAVDLLPLVAHSHHLVHTSALTVIKELARGLRQSFFNQCNGEDMLSAVCHRTREKKLRPLLNDVLDTFFATGAIPLSNVIETVIPNLLDPLEDSNKPIVRLTVWKWLRRCIGRTDPEPQVRKAIKGDLLSLMHASPEDGGSKLLLRDTRTKLLILQVASRGVMTDFQYVEEAKDVMFALIDLVARGSIRAAAIPSHIAHEGRRSVAYLKKKREGLVSEAEAAARVLDEVASGRAATASSMTSTTQQTSVYSNEITNDDDDDDDDNDDENAKKMKKEFEALANEPAPEEMPDDIVGRSSRIEIQATSLYLDKLGASSVDPNSRLSELITANKQRLMECCAHTLGISLEVITDDDDNGKKSRPNSRSGGKHHRYKKGEFSALDPWRGGEINPPWWLPSPNELAARRKQLEEAAAAALAASTKEPPLKIKERLDRQIKEMRNDLESAMRAKNFMQCLSIQKGIDQLKFDRRNIPGLSEELVAITSLQCLVRGMLGRKLTKEKKFQASLPPPPWIEAIDPVSKSKYYWDPYRDYSTWDLQETGIELRKEIELREAVSMFGVDILDKALSTTTVRETKDRVGARSNSTTVGTESFKEANETNENVNLIENKRIKEEEEKEEEMEKQEVSKMPEGMELVNMDVPFDLIRKHKVIASLREEAAREALELERIEEELEAKRKEEESDDEQVGGIKKKKKKKKKRSNQYGFNPESNDQPLPGTAAFALAALEASAGTVDLGVSDSKNIIASKSAVVAAGAGSDGVTIEAEEDGTVDIVEAPMGTLFDNQRLWRLIPKDQDIRPNWRIHFDSGRVHFEHEYQNSRKRVTFFRVPQRYSYLEPLVADDWKALLDSGEDFKSKPLHTQRLDHFLKVSPKVILRYAYQMVGQSWHPRGEGISESKWSKFIREMKIFPDMHKPKRSAQVELGFKRFMHEQDENISDKRKQLDKANGIGGRCLNEEYFEKAIVEMVLLRHPKMADNPSAALQSVLMDSVMMMSEVNAKVWNESKRLAMIAEGRRQSAVTRIQAIIRKVQQVDIFRTRLRCLVILQALMRRYRCMMRYNTRRRYLLDDLFYRVRWISAIIIQMAFRRFVAIRSFKKVIRIKHNELLSRLKGRRVKQNQRHKKRVETVMYRRVRTVNGTLTLQEMTRTSKGTLGDDDFGVLLSVYTPKNQRYFKFDIPDAQLRDFIYQSTGRVKFGGNEIIEARYLRIVCDRLMCRVIEGAPIIYMSKKSTAERGVQIAKRGVNIEGGGRLIVTCYWSNDEVVFQTYDTKESRPMRTALTMVVLRNWLTDQLVWERKRAKRFVNAKRGEARKMLKCESLGIPVPKMHLGWARDYLSKTGGDKDCGIEVWTPDSKPWESEEVPIDTVLSVESIAANKLGYQRRMEAEAEMGGWTEESVQLVSKATQEAKDASIYAKKVKDGLVPLDENGKELVAVISPSNKDLLLESTESSINDESDVEEEEVEERSGWEKEYALRFPEMPVPPSTFFEDELLEMGEEPPLLRINRRKDLVDWLLSKLHIARFKQGPMRGLPQLVLAYELDLDNQAEAAAKIQGLQRMYKARRRVRISTKLKFEKRYDRESGSMYYVFVPTEWAKHSAEAEWQWKKPRCLAYRGLSDDCPAPVDGWRDMYVHITEEEQDILNDDPKSKAVSIIDLQELRGTSQEDGPPCTSKYYMNPATGQTTHMNISEAATVIQRLVRHFLSREIGKVTTKLMIKALKIQFDSEEKYLAFPNRLSSIVNWAMVLHTMHQDLDNAKILYKKAMEISPENPVLLRASSLFTLMTCEPPRTSSWTRAMKNLRAAELRDPTREKFLVAEECLFHWAVVCNPKNARCLLSYALLLQCVVKNYDLAEKFYRRAIAQDADDKFVVRNYLDFEAQRLPGGLYAGGGPPLSALKTSNIQEEKFEWGEWKLMRNTAAHDQRFSLYWAAQVLGKTSWEEPNWDDVWLNIVARSTKIKDLGGWVEWFDPKLKVGYFQNPQVNPPKYQKQSPYHTGDLSKSDRKSNATTTSGSASTSSALSVV